MEYILETIAFNIESCRLAQAAGAHRIELCDNPGEGGTTPSYGFIKAARKVLTIDVFPIIRPRGGDFLYSDDEFEIMKTDIMVCKELGCDGVVFGILKNDAIIDVERCKELVQLAYPMEATFHRAFDRVTHQTEALEQIINCGFTRILTSGGYPSALEGFEQIAALIKQADNRIFIMPGSNLRSENIVEIAEKTSAVEFHTSARKQFPSKMQTTNANMQESLTSVGIDEEQIKQIIDFLHKV